MSTFAGAEFTIVAESDTLPDIARGDGSLKRYSCTAQFDAVSDLTAIQALYSVIDTKQVLGTLGSNVHVQAGYGSGSLHVMTGRNVSRTVTAFLVAVTNIVSTGRYPLKIRATLEFVIPT